jgi:hypothetical protein
MRAAAFAAAVRWSTLEPGDGGAAVGELDRCGARGHPLDEVARAGVPRPPAVHLGGADHGDGQPAVERRALHRDLRGRVSLAREGVRAGRGGRERGRRLRDRHGEARRLVAVHMTARGVDVHGAGGRHDDGSARPHRRQQRLHVGRGERHEVDEQVDAVADEPLDPAGVGAVDGVEAHPEVRERGGHGERIPARHVDRPAVPREALGRRAADRAGAAEDEGAARGGGGGHGRRA